MRKVQDLSIPSIHPFTHLFIHHIFLLVQRLAPHPSPSTLQENEVIIYIFVTTFDI